MQTADTAWHGCLILLITHYYRTSIITALTPLTIINFTGAWVVNVCHFLLNNHCYFNYLIQRFLWLENDFFFLVTWRAGSFLSSILFFFWNKHIPVSNYCKPPCILFTSYVQLLIIMIYFTFFLVVLTLLSGLKK